MSKTRLSAVSVRGVLNHEYAGLDSPASGRRSSARRLIISLALLVLCAPVSARPPAGMAGEEYRHRIKFDRLTLADGLSQVSGNVILQDSRGFIWIGTQDGLNRYDGYSVEVFKRDPDDPDSLADNYILGLYEGRGICGSSPASRVSSTASTSAQSASGATFTIRTTQPASPSARSTRTLSTRTRAEPCGSEPATPASAGSIRRPAG